MKTKLFFAIFFLLALTAEPLLVCAKDPAPEKKSKKQKQQTEQSQQREEVIMPVDIDIPVGKTQQEINEENAIQINQKWEKYLSERIAEIQQLFDNISQLDSNAITKENIEEYHIAANNLKEKVDFKLGNDPLWKENDELDEMRAQFSEIHARTLKKLKYWEEKLSTAPPATNKWIIVGMILLAIMAIVPVFSQIKSMVVAQNAKKQAKKMMQQQQKEAEKQMLLADEKNIINIE